MYKKIAIISAGLILVGAGCASQPKTTEPTAQSGDHVDAPGTPANHHDAAEDHAGIEHISTLAGTLIELDNKNNLKPGEVTFSFKLYGLDGHEFGPNDLKVAHEKKMHFLLVRDDMTNFQHIHPEYANGKWLVKTTVLEAGAYNMYVDIAPIEEAAVVLRVPVQIGGPTAKANFPVPTDNTATDGLYKATLKTVKEIKTNEHTTLTFALTKNNQAVTDLSPYLGAYGHVVLIRHTDVDDFFHVHPLTETKPANGEVAFEAQFPVKGRYTLYAQFTVAGSVKTFPITVDVGTDGQDTDTTHGHGEEKIEEAAPAHHGE